MTIQAVNFPADEPPQWDRQRWQALRDRLTDELSRGYTMLQVALETMPKDVAGMRNPDVAGWKTSIEEWARDGAKFRQPGRYFGEPSHASRIETALENWFSDLDQERAGRRTEPGFVPTSVSRTIIVEGFVTARELKKMVEIEVLPGSGKTFTAETYLAQCRKTEGFDCPVWLITLDETNYNKKTILYEIAAAIYGNGLRGFTAPDITKGEHWLSNHIKDMAASRKGGLLIIDEAQNMLEHLRGVTNRCGIEVISQLRHYTDKKLFGVALLGNGEIYRQARSQSSAQLTRRMEAWRVDVGKPTEDDIDRIMATWNVSGKEERTWCIKIGTGEGSLGAMTEIFRAALLRFKVINISTLSYYRKD